MGCGKGKVYIVVHGTSQDMASVDENTVKLVKELRQAGRDVIEFGGPGSSERPFRTNYKPYYSEAAFEMLGEWNVDLLFNTIAGAARGYGMRDIIEDVLNAIMHAAIDGKCIYIAGFSRGAVAVAKALEQAEVLVKKRGLPKPKVEMAVLYDPVPGYLITTHEAAIPSFVKTLHYVISAGESRIGFRHLRIRVSDLTKLITDVCAGVHGDIGGSTLSLLAALNMHRLREIFGIATSDQAAIIRVALNSLLYSALIQRPNGFFGINCHRIFEDEKGVVTKVGGPVGSDEMVVPCEYAIEKIKNSLVAKILLTEQLPNLEKNQAALIKAECDRHGVDYEKVVARRSKPTNLTSYARPLRGTDGKVFEGYQVRKTLPAFEAKSLSHLNSFARKSSRLGIWGGAAAAVATGAFVLSNAKFGKGGGNTD